MARIPVGATLAQAWHFVRREFPNILGIMAVPLAVSWLPGFITRHQAAGTQNWKVLAPLYALVFVLSGMQVIAIARLALGTKSGPRWLFFSLDRPVWRLLGSLLFLILLVVLGVLGAVLVNALLLGLAKALIGTDAGWHWALYGAVVLVGSVAIWCALAYCVVRLGFLLAPVIAAGEPDFAVARAWTLSAGNFWRILAIILAIWIPVLLLECVFYFAVLLRGLAFPPMHATPAQMAAFRAGIDAHMVQLMTAIYDYWYISLPLYLLVMALFYGFSLATQVFAWRSLTASAPLAGHSLPD